MECIVPAQNLLVIVFIEMSSRDRPESSSSRSAWNDDGLDAPGRPVSGSSDGSSVAKRDTKSASPSGKGDKKPKMTKKKKENACTKIVNCEYVCVTSQ